MVNKFILIVHLIAFGVIVGDTIHVKSSGEILSLGTILFTGYLTLQNLINKLLDKQEEHISK